MRRVAEGRRTVWLDGRGMADLVAGLLKSGVRARFVARGGSMSPAIRDGDVVTVEPVTGPLEAGDVAAVRGPRSDRLLVHRLVAKTPDGWLTQGDAVARPDGVVPEASVLGRVVAVERSWRSRLRGLLAHLRRVSRAVRARA